MVKSQSNRIVVQDKASQELNIKVNKSIAIRFMEEEKHRSAKKRRSKKETLLS